MTLLKQIADARTQEEEMTAVRAWVDGGGPDEGVHFVVRLRGSEEEVPLGDISLDDFERLEVEFSSADDDEGETVLWEPKSREALELFFVE